MQAFDFTNLINALNSDLSFDPMELDENDNTYLHHIVQQCDDDTEFLVRKLINKHTILDHQNIFGQTVYHLAARFAPPNIFKLLIELPGDFYDHDQEMDIDDVHGNSVAHYASADNIPILAEYGFTLNRRNFDGLTPLLDAVHKNHIERACTLLEYGALPNCVDRNGNSALHYCVSRHVIRGPIIDAIFSAPNTKYNIKNKDGFNPLDIAINLRSPELIRKLWYTWEFKAHELNHWLHSDELSNSFKKFLQTLPALRTGIS